jgi:hypothetical protein
VIPVGFSDHCAIILQMDRQNDKPPSPFKFNPLWLEDVEYMNLVEKEWISFDPNSKLNIACFQFIFALKKVNKATLDWVSKKKRKMDKDLKFAEKDLLDLFETMYWDFQ